jgi:hypothetical protein
VEELFSRDLGALPNYQKVLEREFDVETVAQGFLRTRVGKWAVETLKKKLEHFYDERSRRFRDSSKDSREVQEA